MPLSPVQGRYVFKPGEDIKALTLEEPSLLQSVKPAFETYNEEQLTAIKLPSGSQNV